MTNVRLDANGLAKGPVFEATLPSVHRTGVTAVDASDPAGSAGIDAAGYEECRFDLDLTATGFQSLKVAVLYWNPRKNVWFQGGERTFVTTGHKAVAAPCRGQRVFLKVLEFYGTSFSLDVDYALS